MSIRRTLGGVSGLAAPLPLAALALLAVNDHVLKARFPGAWTGKLSDLAGCFLLPLAVAEALALTTRLSARIRAAAGAAATAILFASIKLSPAAADHVARALTAAGGPLGLGRSRIACDPTDLVALPMVALAALYAARRTEAS